MIHIGSVYCRQEQQSQDLCEALITVYCRQVQQSQGLCEALITAGNCIFAAMLPVTDSTGGDRQ